MKAKLPAHPSLDFRVLFESVPGLYLVLDSAFIIVAASNEYLRATMTRREDVIGRDVFDIFPDNPDDAVTKGEHNVRASFNRVLKDRLTDVLPLQKYDIKGPDGHYVERYWSPTNSPVLDEKGDVAYIIHRVEDVTEFVKLKHQSGDKPSGQEYEIYSQSQKVAATNEKLYRELGERELLTESHRKREILFQTHLRAVVDHALDGLISIDARGNVESFNPACECIFGYEAGEVIGKNIKMLMPEPYHTEHDGYLAHYHGTGEARIIGTAGREVRGRRKDGSIFPIDLSVSAFELEDGKHFSGTLRDITVRKKAENEMEMLVQKLTESNTELERFAYICSHDLQEPLRMISNFSQRLESHLAGALDDKARHYMKYVTDGAAHARQLIGDILNYARLDNDAELLADVDGQRVLDDVLQDLSVRIQETGAHISQDLLPVVHIQPTHLRQLLQNLIANALKFCAEKPRIHIGVTRESDCWRFCVRDNGIGIAPEHQGKLFAIFQRLHNRDQYPGTGIGLAVCKKVTQKYSGKIWVESVPGEGSTFFFTLPCRKIADMEVAA